MSLFKKLPLEILQSIALLLDGDDLFDFSKNITKLDASFWRKKIKTMFNLKQTSKAINHENFYRMVYKPYADKQYDQIVLISIRVGYLEVIKKLIETHNIDIHLHNEEKLQMAAKYGHLHIVIYLIEERDADTSARNGGVLREAAENGYKVIVAYLLQNHNRIRYVLRSKYIRYDMVQFISKFGKWLIKYK